ncbi:uncharacterized protein DS421_3g75140 [Arachis hypogaea]|nr:uncharacterized protein DS421_3g75140 [Arachis hypogaea]
MVVVRTKPRGCIESDDRTPSQEPQEPYLIDDSTPSKMVVDTGEPIALRSAVMDNDIIDLGINADALPLEDDDLQEEDGVDGDEEEEDEFNDNYETTSEEEDGEPEEENDKSE